MNKQVILTFAAFLFSLVSLAQNQIQGVVLYHFNPEYPIEGVFVGLYNQQNNLMAVDVTDEEGIFEFENIPDGTYTCKATTDLEGADIGLRQAFLIWLRNLGFLQFEPIEEEAADVDATGVVNMADVQFILTNYFVYNQPLPAGEWIFTDLTVTTGLKEGGNPIGGTKVGDVEGVFVPAGREENLEPVINLLESVSVTEGQVIQLPVKLTGLDAIKGFGLVLDYDNSMLEVMKVRSVNPDLTYSVTNNQIRLSSMLFDQVKSTAFDEVLVEIEVRIIRQPELNSPAFVLSEGSHILDEHGRVNNEGAYGIPVLKGSENSNSQAFVFPNPVINQATIGFYNVTGSSVEMHVFDQSGRLMMNHRAFLPQGWSQSVLPIESLASGTYHLLIVDPLNHQLLHKQMLIKK